MPRRPQRLSRRPETATHRPKHRAVVGSILPMAVRQAVALLAIGGAGMIALSVTTAGERLSGAVVVAGPGRVAATAPAHHPGAALAHPRAGVVEPAAKPAAAAAGSLRAPGARRTPARRSPAHGQRKPAKWLPTGTGMWIYQWNHSNGGRASAVMKRAKVVGLTHLFVRTGSTHDGFTGTDVLRAVLPAARKAHLQVIAWDFPELTHPVADARRLARAAKLVAPGGGRVSAVAPDIETPAEGTHSTRGAVRLYLTTLRKLLPSSVPILATVPWPSSSRVGHYPYATVAAHSDALLPMAYWYNNSPTAVTAASVKYLRQFHRPVMPVGQGYDGRLDVPSLPPNNLAKQVPAFFAAAHQMGARAVSLWSWQSAPNATWRALKSARRLFPAR